MSKAKLYKADGTIIEVVPANGTDFQLDELQAMVDGYIEIVPAGNGKIMVIDEEGKLKGKPVNDAATIIHYAKKLDYVDSERVVVCGHSEGAMIATLLTKQEKLQGIILLSGACMEKCKFGAISRK